MDLMPTSGGSEIGAPEGGQFPSANGTRYNNAARKRQDSRMPKLNRDGVNIYYEIHGNGPPLLLTHGYSSTSAMWRGQIAALSKHHQLVLWDMRGHGQSDYPDDTAAYSETLTVGDMAALLDKVDAATAIVGGLSLGGYMSLAFVRAHPQRVRALLIIDTGPGFKKDEARDAWNKRAFETGDRFEREGLDVLKSASRERSSVVHRDASGLARAARGMLTQRDAGVIETLPHIKVPALVVVGADDTPFLAASDYMAAKIPGAKKVVIPAAGHAANIDQPQAFIDAVVPFLDGLPQQGVSDKRVAP
jgi:pimeloyl-ACP methyl ester carboxylesterase